MERTTRGVLINYLPFDSVITTVDGCDYRIIVVLRYSKPTTEKKLDPMKILLCLGLVALKLGIDDVITWQIKPMVCSDGWRADLISTDSRCCTVLRLDYSAD
jgi:hypothetical protein